MSKIEFLRDFVFPGIIGMGMMFLWKVGNQEIVIFMIGAILTLISFQNTKERGNENIKIGIKTSNLKALAKKIQKISKK